MSEECPGCAVEWEDGADRCPICGYERPAASRRFRLLGYVALLAFLLPTLFALTRWFSGD